MRRAVPPAPALLLVPALLLALLLAPAPALAQSPLLPPDHWVFPVLGRLEVLGALPAEYDPSAPSWTVGRAMRALRAASEPSSSAAAVELARAAAGGLAAEAPTEDAAAENAPGAGRGASAASRVLLPGWVGADHITSAGALLAGYDTVAGAPGVAPVEDSEGNDLAVAARLALRAPPWLAAELVPLVGSGGVSARSAHVVVRPTDSFLAWAGRRSMAMAVAPGSAGLVVGAPYRVDGVGAALAPAGELPGPLAWLGPVNLDMVLSRAGSAGATASPWFWALHGSVRPHPRLRLGIERAALMGGAGNVGVGPRDVLEMLVGTHGDSSAVNNQVLALDAWYRPPLGPLPVAVYVSWAMDDASGAWKDVPAYLAGARLAAVPGLPAVALAVERVSLAGSCCGNPPWYRHLQLPWLDGRRPLGHPVAGQGREWRARARLDLPADGLLTSFELFTRHRGGENPLAPDRAGSSRGAQAGLRFRPAGRSLEILSGLGIELGDTDWRVWSGELAVRVWSW